MAFYIEVIKANEEDEYFVYYVYQFSLPVHEFKTASGKVRYKSKMVNGQLKIDKRNGDVHTLELAEGDEGFHAQRASWALMKHWKVNEYPEKTCWTS